MALVLALAAGCSDDSGTADGGGPDGKATADAATADSGGTDSAIKPDTAGVTCLGTLYPGVGVINPDNPDYSDSLWSKTEVKTKFAQAKAQGLQVYKAYKAAYDNADVLYCAFCACGCAGNPGHLSAVDCFKDMHGFT
jgi:hypothetical protein